jgi:uncharacterized protein (DUF488 family)
MSSPVLCTIGFTKKSAEQFFSLLKRNGVSLLADIRLNNSGQLAGYTKAKDLAYFLSLLGIKYEHWKDFAPTKELRNSYHSDWNFEKYAQEYTSLVTQRRAIERLRQGLFESETVCLLCSEATAEKCHRRVAADLIRESSPGLEIKHL